jgi:hypothetical protein
MFWLLCRYFEATVYAPNVVVDYFYVLWVIFMYCAEI